MRFFLEFDKRFCENILTNGMLALQMVFVPNPNYHTNTTILIKVKGYGAFDGLMVDILQKTLYKNLKQCYKIATLIK